jgi:hypothetical protein
LLCALSDVPNVPNIATNISILMCSVFS